ncbi:MULTISPECIES: IS110 family transposase [Pseudoalteromonas]|uniref:IS110 family transposase n=1 Tax=Pseudoalteromonas TaxID=53246 RepID=UPI0015840748|nr:MULTISPECIES: IS110 family transposase [Pseudoalteromonas]MDI4654765.1 IS110 family transposase [Pseudoalteromonas shioyasakiensis]NUJ41169.1 IS110 family transposase [Pseudoalteromonas sp. 0303]
MNKIVVGVDLAKNEIQVCVTKHNKVHSNEAMTPRDFKIWLANSDTMTIVFEACSTSNYWKQQAIACGHDSRLISAKLVAQIRQNQKTDKNDALAIVQASQLANVDFVNGKSKAQQALQSLVRLRELAIKQKVASYNQLTGLLLEFNIRVAGAKGGITEVVKSILEDADNDFSPEFRHALNIALHHYQSLLEDIAQYDMCIEKAANQHKTCKSLMAIEGVGPLNAINLYISLGCGEIGTFKKGRDAAACIGLTPIQHSSGGKVKLGSIGKYVKNKTVRSYLVSGAMSVVNQATRRVAKTKKELWIQQLVERKGKRCAAVALANKTVRTAFSMLTNKTEYKAELLSAK